VQVILKLIIKLRHKSLIKSFDKPLIYNSITNIAINLMYTGLHGVDYARTQGYTWEVANQDYMRVYRVMYMNLHGLQGTTQSYTAMLT